MFGSNGYKSAFKRARKRLNDLYEESRHFTRNGERSWHYVHRATGISTGTIIRIARDGYEPRTPTIRRALGLPEFVTVVACSRCGAIHDQLKTCPSKRKPRRPRRHWVPPLLAAIRAACRRMTVEEISKLKEKTR